LTTNATVAPDQARLSTAIRSENETMPTTGNGTVQIATLRPTAKRSTLQAVGEQIRPPRRRRNSERRPREYLTPAEVETLIVTAKKRGRYGHRDATMILIDEASPLAFPVHPHMLRHACGYKLANDGQDTRALQHYLGHRNIQHTVRYTELAVDRFKGFWPD